MEFGFGQPKQPQNNRTINYLQKEGGVNETVSQVKEALEIANESLDVKDRITVSSVEKLLKWASAKENLSCASYFDNARFTEESKDSQELGLDKEAISDEAGVWGHRFFIKPTDQATAEKLVWQGLHEARVQNLRGLRQIHQENVSETNYSFDDRTEPQHLMSWRDTLAKHQTTELEAHKEWDNTFSREYGILPRLPNKRDDESLFKVETVNKSDKTYDRGFGEIIKDRNVAKVILFRNDEGNIDSVEIWYPHFTCDQAQGSKVTELVGSKFEIDESKNTNSLEVLRNYQVKDSEGEIVNILDIENNFRLSEDEKKIIDKATALLSMNRSAYFAYSWMAIESEKSAYICVSPGPPESKAAGLQFALLPSPADIKKLDKPLEEATWNFSPKIINMIVQTQFINEVAKPVIRSMNTLSNFSKAEIKKARKAMSTLSILGVYLGSISRKIFKSALNKQHKLFAEGSFQVSSVVSKDKKVKNLSFITATNLTAKRVLAIQSDEKGIGCNLRVVTDRALQSEVYIRWGRRGVNRIDMDDFKSEAKKIIMEKQINFRRALVFMSLMIINQRIQDGVGALKDRPSQELYNLASKALDNINSEAIEL